MAPTFGGASEIASQATQVFEKENPLMLGDRSARRLRRKKE